MAKKSDRKKLIDQLDKLSKQLVYQRDNYTCQRCGKNDGRDYQASHVIPVSAGQKLRWDIQNMKVLCYHCHLNWWHKNPIEASDWFKKTFPHRVEYLEANKGIYKFTITELEELKDKYTEELKNNTHRF